MNSPLPLFVLFVALAWLPCGKAAYWLFRSAFRTQFGSWTVLDRCIASILCLLCPPLALLLAFIVWIPGAEIGKNEAKW